MTARCYLFVFVVASAFLVSTTQVASAQAGGSHVSSAEAGALGADLRKAAEAMHKGDLAGAEQKLRQALKADPNSLRR